MAPKIILEACVNSIETAIAAQSAGADRIELCGNMEEGGTTPGAGLIATVLKNLHIPVQVIIRPRGGDFVYSELDFEVMKAEVEISKQFGVDGLVLGILRQDGRIDLKRCEELVRLAHPIPLTFHRAFDLLKDPFKAIDELINLGFVRVLGSGSAKNALDGASVLQELVTRAGDRLSVMPGGGINPGNILAIAQQTKAREYHFSAFRKIQSGPDPEWDYHYEGDPEKIRRIREVLNGG